MITSWVEPAPAPSGPSVGEFGDSAGKRWLRVAPDLVILSGFSRVRGIGRLAICVGTFTRQMNPNVENG